MPPNAPATGIVSKSEYARHRKVTPAMVTKWHKAGRIVLVDGGVDLAKSDAALAATLDPARGGKHGKSSDSAVAAPTVGRGAPVEPGPAPGGATDAYSRVRTHREAYKAKSEEIDYRVKVGELVEGKAVAKAIGDALSPIMAALDSLSSILGPAVAAESDPRKVENLIDAEVDRIRQDAAETLRRMIPGAPGSRQ